MQNAHLEIFVGDVDVVTDVNHAISHLSSFDIKSIQC